LAWQGLILVNMEATDVDDRGVGLLWAAELMPEEVVERAGARGGGFYRKYVAVKPRNIDASLITHVPVRIQW
jgi:hypothetical protein